MSAPAQACGWQEFVAPPEWRSIDFISDLHLAEDTPRTFEAWRDHLLNTRADAVIILGDLFEAWVGDDARHEGFETRAAATLIEASARRSIGFMVGNRDFLLGREMLDACGVLALPDPTLLTAFAARALLTHGDAWCLADVDYQQYRQQVRDPAWRSQVLARPLTERRALARSMRAQSAGKAAGHAGTAFDVDRTTALRWMADADAPTLVHGHTHRPATDSLATGRTRHVLSDWDCDHGAGSGRAEVLRWSAGGWARMTPAEATAAEATAAEAQTRTCPAG